MANNLSRDKQIAVIKALVEGCSIRSTERMTDVNRETIGTLLVRVGNGCADLLDRTMRDLDTDRLELDELWAFVGKKQPDADLVSTSYVERQNLTVRMGVRRYTRLTNAFRKKLENHIAATALHFAHYNFCRIHKTLRTTPAMAANVSATLWSADDLLNATIGAEK